MTNENDNSPTPDHAGAPRLPDSNPAATILIETTKDADGADLADGSAGEPDPSNEPSDEPSDEDEQRPVWMIGPILRMVEWAERPWPNDRIARTALTAMSIVVPTLWMMWAVHLGPVFGEDLIFDDTTPTGGDFGAHVWGPAYLRDHILPSGWFNGWSMDWYAGLPTYRFYMVLPALMILVADVVLPYGVAMKLVSVLGVVFIPAACWAFGRLASFKYPMPEVFAFAGLAFVLDESFGIYGGNLKSTMAGEFSFSIALAIAIVALGLLARGLETGQYRVWAAALLAAACVSHGIVLIFVALAASVFCLVWIDAQRWFYVLTTGVTTLLLAAWWVGPFLIGHDYMTDMKYAGEPIVSFDSWWAMFFPLTAPLNFIITTLAIFGFVMAIVRRHLNAAALGVLGIFLVGLTFWAKDSLPLIGLLWNPRILPFLYLVRYLMMAYGAVEMLGLLNNLFRDRPARATASAGERTVFGATVSVSILLVLGFMFQVLPFGGNEVQADGGQRYTWGPITATETNSRAVGDAWARYNFEGYEGRGAKYNEYREIVTTMAAIGDQYGCGRANWENHSDNGEYGTTMALMLLPHWTDGCIASMEGLFFEASGTTPYHFLTTAAMSESSSNPVRKLRYINNDASVGVEYLKSLGVKYVMVRTDAAKAEAADHPELTYLDGVGPWEFYLVEGATIVEPLTVQPVVVNERGGDRRERLLEVSTSWFQNRSEWLAMPANDGPDDWQRIDVAPDLNRREMTESGELNKVDIVTPQTPIEPVQLDPITVSNVDIRNQSLSFDVDQVGVPVLVRVSYFPNWNATGADGPYRIGPNMMVVVPTDTTVELSYGQSFSDYLFFLLALIGVGLCVYWRFGRGDEDYALAADTQVADRSSGEPDDPPAGTPADAAGAPGALDVDDGDTDDGDTGDDIDSITEDHDDLPGVNSASGPELGFDGEPDGDRPADR